MDSSFDVPDPSDWLKTSIKQLAPVEAALRCQVCKDFFDTPMVTSCSHTFCSLCIRRCLTSDGKCPTCRAPDQELRLRRNWTAQEVVDAFKAARPAVIQLGLASEATKYEQRKVKRKLDDTGIEEDEDTGVQSRKTRSQCKKTSRPQQLDSIPAVVDEEDSDYQPEDGLIACPICEQRMEEIEVFSHLDIHREPKDASANGLSQSRNPPFVDITNRAHPMLKPLERLPQLSYSLLKDNALRKKLLDLGIPNGGPRALLTRRHTEWVNLVNANCDSSRPRTKRALLHELDLWDRSQGHQLSNSLGTPSNASSVMRKDFDGAAWAASHGDDFQRLISIARPKASTDRGLNTIMMTDNTPVDVPQRQSSDPIPSTCENSDNEPRESSSTSSVVVNLKTDHHEDGAVNDDQRTSIVIAHPHDDV